MKVCEPFGPEYPQLGAGLAKQRNKAKGGLMLLSKEERSAYADAVETAIRAKQRQALQRELPSHNVSCASGTNHNDGEAISAAIRQQHRSALLAAPSKERAARSAAQWQEMYDAAMAEKRARVASNVLPFAPALSPVLPEEALMFATMGA